MSEAPPGAKGTSRVTGRVGHAACAQEGAAAESQAAKPRAWRRVMWCMASLPIPCPGGVIIRYPHRASGFHAAETALIRDGAMRKRTDPTRPPPEAAAREARETEGNVRAV